MIELCLYHYLNVVFFPKWQGNLKIMIIKLVSEAKRTTLMNHCIRAYRPVNVWFDLDKIEKVANKNIIFCHSYCVCNGELVK